MKRSRNYGFTLIEVMITIAIVAILSLLAVYMFQTYSGKAKAMAALSELRSLAVRYDAIHVSGIVSPTLEDLEVSDSNRCRFSIAFASNSEVNLVCELINVYGPLLGGVLTYHRSGEGKWDCSANNVLASEVLPPSCK
jgi:type IV pilus assembly protein PilA